MLLFTFSDQLFNFIVSLLSEVKFVFTFLIHSRNLQNKILEFLLVENVVFVFFKDVISFLNFKSSQLLVLPFDFCLEGLFNELLHSFFR